MENERQIKKETKAFGRPATHWRRWTATAVLFTFVVGVSVAGVLPRVTGEAAPRAGWYLSSGQLAADLRTVSAAIRYMLEAGQEG